MPDELAIIIDCWETTEEDSVNVLCFNIINFISQREEIKYVVLASYDTLYSDQEHTIWKENYHRIMEKSPIRVKYLYELAENSRKLIEHNSLLKLGKTDPDLLEYVFENKFQISMTHFFELEYLLKQNQEIDTIWFFGAGWKQCLKNRELGWKYMKEFTGKELLTISTCIGPFFYKVDDDPNWEKVDWGDFIYRHK
jgi:hypothetical protein